MARKEAVREDLYGKIRARVEKMVKEAEETGEWQNAIVASVDYPATVSLELAVAPPRDENSSARVILRLRTARFTNSMVVTPEHIDALANLIDMIKKSEHLQTLLDVLRDYAPARRKRVKTFFD